MGRDINVPAIRRLIESGAPENLEMAVQLTANCTDEFRWLHGYCVARTQLPPQYASWYALYAEVVKYCRERVLIPKEFYGMDRQGINAWEFRMTDIQENVTNELHYMMFRERAHEISRDMHTTRHALQHHYGVGLEEAGRNKTLELSGRLLRLLQLDA